MRLNVPITMLCLGLLPRGALSLGMSGQEFPSAPSEPSHSELAAPDSTLRADHQDSGMKKAELQFDPATQTVTLKVQVHSDQGTFIPNIRPDDFVVYENGVRQPEPTVEVERVPVTLGILLEYGGRHSALNTALGDAVSAAVRQFQGEISEHDKVAFWRYGDHVEELSGFATSHDQLLRTLSGLGTPPLSETNLYDALIDTVGRLGSVSGRKALVLVSSGIDTFSNHSLADALEAVRKAGIPVYVINLDAILKEEEAPISNDVTRYEPVNWQRATRTLREIARASGGHMYSPQSSYAWSGTYDNLMESLRVRYAITYRSTTTSAAAVPRKVRIEVLEPKAAGPLQGPNPEGHPMRERIVAEARYTPESVSEREAPTARISPSA